MAEELKDKTIEEQDNGGAEPEGTEPKSYTQAEVDALLQSEVDRRITSALKKQETKLKEAQRVAQMNEQEKYIYQLEQREKQVAEKEVQLALAEMKNTTSKVLADKGLSLSLVDLVVNADADITNANIKLLEKAFKDSVKAEVEKRLGSSTPRKAEGADTPMTKEKFNTLSLAELQQLKNNDLELYNQLIQ